MSQLNLKKGNAFLAPPENSIGLGFTLEGVLVQINSDGSTTLIGTGSGSVGTSNILANRGVGLEADLPNDPINGDIYVSTDTFKIFIGQLSSWSSLLLVAGQMVTDTNVTIKVLYQYNGTVVNIIGRGSVTVDGTTITGTGTPADPLIAVTTTNNKGWFATSVALLAAFPTGENGWWAIVGTTDTVWTWDADTTTWLDTGESYTGFAAETHAATAKPTLAAADEFAVVDTAAGNTIKKTTWQNIIDTLKSFFETLRLTTKGDFLGHTGSASVRVGVGTNGQVPTADSTVAHGWDWKTPSTGIPNIIANKGVGLSASKPVTGLTVGDIFVSTDSLLKFTATGATTWDAGVALTTGAFINDTSITVNLLYQYNGTVVKLTGDGGSTSAGHVIKNNTGTSLTARTNLTVKTNGIGTEAAVDNSGADSTDISMRVLSAVDTNPTGIADGDLLKYDLASTTIIPQSVAPFMMILNESEANLAANGILTTYLLAGYKIDTIIIKNQTANAAGNISIGTSAAGTQIVNAATVGASAVVDCTLVEDFFSDVNDTDLYISSSTWGTGVVTVYFTFKRII